MVTIALHVIAKDEITQVEQILKAYCKYFDEVDIAVDDKLKEFEKLGKDYKANIYLYKETEERLNFAHKRNFLMSKCKTDYILRLDTDDEIVNPEEIRPVLDKAVNENISVVSCYYDYSKDEWGNTNMAHYRETIIENSTNLYWNKAIHENVLSKSGEFSVVRDNILKINHLIDYAHAVKSSQRNLQYLIAEYLKDKEKTDSRTLAYLGRSFFGQKEFKKAIFFLQRHIQTSGWDEDRYSSWCELSDIYRLLKDYNKSIACAYEALSECPDFPDAYFRMHDTYFNQSQWEKAIEWGTMGFSKKSPETNIPIDPTSRTWQPMLSMASCYFSIGKFEQALKVFSMAKKFVPGMKYIKDMEPIYKEAVEHDNYIKSLYRVYSFTKNKASEKIKPLVESIPKELYQHELISSLRDKYLPSKQWGKKDIEIFCLGTPEEWTPDKVETGIGGSEEAVIQLSRELTKLGWKVTVFNNCGDKEGDYDGVNYLNVVRFRRKDKHNILISWRINIFGRGVQAANKIVWLHDLPMAMMDFSDDSIKTFDKLVVLSNYHKSLLPDNIPEEKIFVSSNGLVPEDFKGLETVKREPQRIIYASSYNRGLEEMLGWWPEIRKAVPLAELHIFYGWDVYDKSVEGGQLQDNGFKPKMLKLFQQEGIFEHGRVGHKKLLREYSKSAVFAYYCTYAGEINCLALSKAIACGCIPITNNRYALGERNLFSIADIDFKDTLIETLEQKNRIPFEKDYIQKNSWKFIAEDWTKNLLTPKIETIVEYRQDWIHSLIGNNGSKIVDIGCNNGSLFEGYDRKNITSVDLDKYDLPNFVQSNAEELPFENKEFDIAIVAEVLEHVPDPVKALKEAYRVAKKVIISVPYEYEWNSILKPFNTLEKEMELRGMTAEELANAANNPKEFVNDGYNHLYHLRQYTPKTLEDDFKKAGVNKYNIVKLRHGNWTWLGAVLS